MKRIGLFALFVSLITLAVGSVSAQTSELAATMEVLEGTVEVQRVNAANRISVSVEAIIGVGDIVYTSDNGRARITFFADGTTTILENNTTYRIDTLEGDANSFRIDVSVLLGITRQQLNRVLDANSSYNVNTPGMTLAARGTIFDIRVEANERSALIVRENTVDAGAEGANADVPQGFGVRSEVDSPLSDVVAATNFTELDAALDGCGITVATEGDVALNVRIGPSLNADRVGYVDAVDIDTVFGFAEGGWYRVSYASGFGWVSSQNTRLASCAGLRRFPVDHVENPDNYNVDAGVPVLIGT